MNSIWNKNLALFCERFPALAKQCGIRADSPEPDSLPFSLLTAKNGSVIAKAAGKFLHSNYNPEREAEQAVAAARKPFCKACVFLSCGLGYAPNAYAKRFPDDTLIIVEPDLSHFLAAIAVLDWTPVFSARECILILHGEPETVITLIENSGGFSSCAFLANNNQMEHAQAYFSRLSAEIDHAKQQTRINENTRKKFHALWKRNTCRNIRELAGRDGILRYKDTCPDTLPAVILAAGPTLQSVLPHLEEIKKRALLICVDTALRACLRMGTEPDFIVLTDPQYYAARHIAGLSAPHAILITETAVYPSVFHFPCKEIILCSSLFPLGAYIEKKIGNKGSLASGGSVSTTAWEFARYIGAKAIYVAGLDLGYPDYQTHIRGSTFEEKIHAVSCRCKSAETASLASLFGANMILSHDYDGNPILTDNRMTMFASWFETKLKEYPQVKTYSLSSKSLAIQRIQPVPVAQLLSLPEKSDARKQFFLQDEKKTFVPRHDQCDKIIGTLLEDFEILSRHTKTGISVAENALQGVADYHASEEKIQSVNATLHSPELSPVTALVSPCEAEMRTVFDSYDISENPLTATFQRAKIIYEAMQKNISDYRLFLQK